jgi:hypothetical protein
MSETVTANDGTRLELANLPTVLNYNGANVISISVIAADQHGVNQTYTQSFTYAGSNVTNISGWVKQ